MVKLSRAGAIRYPGDLAGTVIDASGHPMGRVHDVVVRLGAALPSVVGVQLRAGRAGPFRAEVTGYRPAVRRGVQLVCNPTPAVPGGAPAATELLLSRDVLDVQVVDVRGRRSGRVGEVLLSAAGDGGLDVVGVDIGVAALCRRFGVARLVAARPDKVVPWPDLHLRSTRGHEVQLAVRASAVHDLDAQGLADLLARLGVPQGAQLLDAVGVQRAADAVASAHPAVADRLLMALPSDRAEQVIGRLPPQHERRIRRLLASRTPLSDRRFLRTHGWRLHRPPPRRVGGSPPAETGGVQE